MLESCLRLRSSFSPPINFARDDGVHVCVWTTKIDRPVYTDIKLIVKTPTSTTRLLTANRQRRSSSAQSRFHVTTVVCVFVVRIKKGLRVASVHTSIARILDICIRPQSLAIALDWRRRAGRTSVLFIPLAKFSANTAALYTLDTNTRTPARYHRYFRAHTHTQYPHHRW